MREHRPGTHAGHRSSRRAFTVTEMFVALTILGMALVVVAQVGLWSLRERTRVSDHQTAEELGNNLLERARLCPWSDLTSDWATAQRLPEPYRERGYRLEVKVQPEKADPLVKRVIVVVHWKAESDGSDRALELVGLFAARTTEGKGENP